MAKRGKAQRTKPAPKKLNWLMEQVNSLPPDAPTWEELEERAKKLREQKIPLEVFANDHPPGLYLFGEPDPQRGIYAVEALSVLFRDEVARLPSKLQDFIGPLDGGTLMSLMFEPGGNFGGRSYEETLGAARDKYNSLFAARDALRAIAKSELRDLLLDALSEEGVDAARIKQCPICKNIFWAGRITKPYCSKQCGQNYRARKFRETYQENYKQQRIEKAKAQEESQGQSKASEKKTITRTRSGKKAGGQTRREKR